MIIGWLGTLVLFAVAFPGESRTAWLITRFQRFLHIIPPNKKRPPVFWESAWNLYLFNFSL
ncbi:hypothetical protein CHCC20327_0143 [Bacillus licheniformis]|nr:hypothetical protein CHCC20327_0143 [Bacillus licheniformis]